MTADGLFAITAYFNPVGRGRRLANYREFRKRLTVPLVAVELAFGDRFELTHDDADILIQVRDGALLWQKERLLALALAALPSAARTIAWLDSDIVFTRPDWADAAGRLLDDAPIIQLFRHVHYMPASLPVAAAAIGAAELRRTSLAAAVGGGVDPIDCFGAGNEHTWGEYTPGFAWAARRDVLAAHGLYDACIIGGGGRAIAAAAYGHIDHVVRFQRMHPAEAAHFAAWAEPFSAAVAGRVGFLDTDILHLWHGDLASRAYFERHRDFAPFAFDPTRDIAIGADGAWVWNSHRPALHDHVRGYFESREFD
ncbi:MAG: hypothetical protein KDK07_26730 [Bauldia sp.]|nr:hypothetical protein [Bauldia sp.]